MTLNEQTKVRQHSRTASRVLEGRALVIVVDERKLHTLNGVGTRVWELADGRSIGAIADMIVIEFEVTRDTALSDVTGFVSQLAELGAIETIETT